MTTLLLEHKLRDSERDAEVPVVARARRRHVVRFQLAARLKTFDFSIQPSLLERQIHELAGLSFM
jgi:hypothetical protein